MLVYILIIAFMLFLYAKLKHELFAMMMGIIMIILFNSTQINDFVINMIAAIDFKTVLYNHRFLMAIILLLIFLIYQIYQTIGFNEKANFYLTKPMNTKTNLLSMVLAPFSDFIKLTRPQVTNKYYLYGSYILSGLFIGSSSFIASYYLITEFLTIQNSLYTILVCSMVGIGTVVLSCLFIVSRGVNGYVDDSETLTVHTPQSFDNMKKMTLINAFLLVIGIAFGVISGKIILFGLAVGLLLCFFFSLFYVDNFLHKHNQRDERVLLRNLLTGCADWFKLVLFLVMVVIFTNIAINSFGSYWQINYYHLYLYLSLIIGLLFIINIFIDNRLMPLILTFPLLVPLMNMLGTQDKMLFLGIYLGCSYLFSFIRKQVSLYLNHELQVDFKQYLVVMVLASLSFIVSLIVMLLTTSIILGYIVLIVLLIVIMIINKIIIKRHA